MTTARTWIPLAALALLCTVGCKKQESTSPDDATASDEVEADEVEAEEAEEADEADEEPAAAMLTKAGFDETIYDNMQAVSDCYVAALEGNADLKGTLEADFTFGADGVPTAVTAVEGSSLSDEGLVQCIAEASKGWGFDPPSEEGMVLRYTFELAPAE